jgi:anti-anti-sigma factor
MQYSMDGMTWQGSGGGPSPWLDFEIKRLTRRDFRLGTLNGLPVVSTPVDLDIDNSRQLVQAILNAGTGATSVVVDMTAVDFIDCSVLGALMRAYGHLADEGIELRIATTNARARWMMSFFGQDSLLRVFDTLPEAVSAPLLSAPSLSAPSLSAPSLTGSPENWVLERQAA